MAASEQELHKDIVERLKEYNHVEGAVGTQILLEIQILMDRINIIQQNRTENRSHRLELLVIALIATEVLMAAWEMWASHSQAQWIGQLQASLAAIQTLLEEISRRLPPLAH